MHQARAMRVGGQRHLLGADGVDGVEALAAALEQDADQVDQHMGVARRRLDRGGVADIGLHGMDLADLPSGCRWPARSGRRTATRMR